MPYIQLFLFLQVLDLLTTLVGFKVGAIEVSPFIRTMMHLGPAIGVVLSKAIACVLAGVCIWLGRQRLIRWANYWYGALVVWNLCVILVARA
jgi:hypothetical protein